ncbi:MAG: TraV family lipoprotein [Candidatus Omnitrophica bacterium]|nr:TraV family lipoprotein [Candidatus Omnitrophota bacterium]
MKKIGILFSGLFLASCGGILNPYSSEFSCPQADTGLCTDPYSAYRLSKQQKQEEVQKVDLEKYVNGRFDNKKEEVSKKDQKIERKQEVSLALQKEQKQKDQEVIIVPPKYVRVLIMPYKDEAGKTIYKERYVYLLLEDSKLIIK